MGLYCYNYSLPWLSNKPSQGCCPGRGYNVIRQNGVGISANYGSNVFMGDREYGGYNCVHNNSGYEFSAMYNSGFTMKLEKTWWNHTTAPYYNTGDFYIYSSALDYDPAYSGPDPNGCPVAPMPKASVAEASVSAVAQADEELNSVYQLEVEGKNEEAVVGYLEKLKKDRDNMKRRYILARIMQCYRASGKDRFTDLLRDDIRQKLVKDEKLIGYTIELEAMQLATEGKCKEAVDRLELISSKYSDDEQLYKDGLYSLVYIYLMHLKDEQKAKGYFDQLKQKYPEDLLTWQLRVMLGEVEKIPAAEVLAKDIKEYKDKPEAIDIFNNYPNPFNAMTTIKYQLPEIGTQYFVSLKVYDILGREVVVLADGVKEAGYYTVEFDGSKLSSGIYLMRFVAQPLSGGSPYVQVRKMLLTK